MPPHPLPEPARSFDVSSAGSTPAVSSASAVLAVLLVVVPPDVAG